MADAAQGLPASGEWWSVALYGALLLVMGATISWAAPACNNPIFAEIVPPHLRNLVSQKKRCAALSFLCSHACPRARKGSAVICWTLVELPPSRAAVGCLQVYAFDRSFEMAIAAMAAPLVGILAEQLFGFSVGQPQLPIVLRYWSV